jgi:hypothetical protein
VSTLDEVIDSALNDYLLTGQREVRNVLASDITSSATTLTTSYAVRGILEGARLCADYEDMYVVTSDSGAKTATVIRGQFGTTAAAHVTGATLWVNPKWSRAQLLRAVNDEIKSLSGAGLFQMVTVDLTFNSQISGYDMTGVTPDDVMSIYEIMADYPGPQNSPVPISSYRVLRDAQTADFPSGMGILLNEPGHPGHTIRVTYKTRFDTVTSADAATDLATAAGLDVEAHDLLSIGAAIRLVSGSEIRRSQLGAQPDTRRADEVPPGATLQSVRGLMALREQRLKEEKARLARRYPARKVMAS